MTDDVAPATPNKGPETTLETPKGNSYSIQEPDWARLEPEGADVPVEPHGIRHSVSVSQGSDRNNEGPQIILFTPEGDSYSLHETESYDFEVFKADELPKYPAKDAPEVAPKPQPTEGPSSLSVVSLICGDFSDHRVCISGSYFAFKFILSMYQHAGRIEATLYRHFDKFLKDVASLFPTLGRRRALSKHALDFTVEDMRKENLRRFTLENDILKKRMLSVTRTARETRFLFHSRVTVLYYGRVWGFIAKDQSDLFEQLVKVQIQHDEEGTDEAR
ncbi:hypothetical protein BJY04DRAFT_224925 [Aspergillus karnatakaensis]|uniref:uncharacterized protein n=1 Tax=Aspergillus karnatakaensis TaxID=1810916 RepID=UPI003CCCE2FD